MTRSLPLARSLSRRRFLGGSAAAAALTALGGVAAWAAAGSDFRATAPLAIPPLEPGRRDGPRRIFDLTIRDGVREFFPGYRTKTRGINADYLAPVLRMSKGDVVRMNVTNALDEDTTLHWHGFTLPAHADGGPHQVIAPGETWSPEFEVMQEASTMFFHSHLMGATARQVWQGIGGMIIVDDGAPPAGLPAEYGVDDIPVVLQDRRFQLTGAMPYQESMHDRMAGMIGNYPVINGTIAPWLDVSRSRVRLRLLNASNGSIYNLVLSDDRPFHVVGSDGGLLAAPVRVSSLRLAPGERAEIVIELDPGQPLRLESVAATGPGPRRGGMMGGGMMGGMGAEQTPVFTLLELRPAARLEPSPPLPARLAPDLPAPDPAQARRTRPFLLEMGMGPSMMMGGGFTINGQAMDMNVINEVVKMGEAEIWRIGNAGPMAHPFHVHDTQFRILTRGGRAPAAHEAGLKDTVLVDPGEVVEILVRFDRYSDPDLPYMYHCHILEHEDGGMMGQFTVV